MESSKLCPKCEKGLMFYHSYFHAYVCDHCENIERTIEADEKDKLISELENQIKTLEERIKEMGSVIWECDFCDTCIHCVIERNVPFYGSECEFDDRCEHGTKYEYRPKSMPKRQIQWNKETKQYEPYIES